MIENKIKKVKMVIFDVDGVLTDGRIIYDNFGDEIKCFNVHDGLGISLLNKAGIKTAIITARSSKIVKRRLKDMHVDILCTGCNKLKHYKNILKKFRLTDEEVCFIGDDLLDIPVLKRVGLSISPKDGSEDVKRIVDHITEKTSGKGVAREVAESILKTKGLWDDLLQEYNV